MFAEKIKKIREIMRENNVDAYYVTSSDFHESEYIGSYFKVREYITGFKGSFGNLLINQNKVVLWTDSRYDTQAKKILSGTEVEVITINKPDTVDLKEWVKNNAEQCKVFAFDGRTVSAKLGLELKEFFSKIDVKINENLNIVDEFWEERPGMSKEKAYILDIEKSGKTTEDKIKEVVEILKKDEIDYNLVTSLDDIAWLLNIRGRDVKNTPVVLSNLIIGQFETVLYIDKNKIIGEVEKKLKESKIIIKEYDEFYIDVKKIEKNKKILVDVNKINTMLYSLISEHKIVDRLNPSTTLKAVKNSVEIKNIKSTHIKDGVAVTKFLYWLKSNIGKIEIDEITAKNKMDSLRAQQDGYIEPSFETISAYMSNAAMPHYSATENDFSKLEERGVYLIDSGGQYFGGTTDITRTIAVGKVSEEVKRDYTLVLKGMLNLSMAKFLHGTTGSNLDFCARSAMWEYGINYAHGTGHGIGYILGVHEGPHGIRITHNPHPLIPGMVVTNEPGIYVINSHGIRIENELLVAPYLKNNYGEFYQFETITYAPIDLEPVIVEMLTEKEKEFLNLYHKNVYNKLSDFLTEEEKQWLKNVTKEI